MTKAVKIQKNQKGKKIALCRDDDGLWSVYVLCVNYASHVRGGIAHTWRYDQKSLTEEAATALFNKRVAGRK